jgi:hypothetical protein
MIPEWGSPRAVRVDQKRIVAKIGGRSVPTDVERLQIVSERPVLRSEIGELIEAFDHARFWTIAAPTAEEQSNERGGSLWILEARRPGRYNVVTRTSSYRRAGDSPDSEVLAGLVALMRRLGRL